MRKSQDGRVWSNPPSAPSYPFLGLGYSSNQLANLSVVPSLGQSVQLGFYSTMDPEVLAQNQTTYIAYAHSTLTINDCLFIKNSNVVSLLLNPTPSEIQDPSLNLVSTFYLGNSSARFRSSLSTTQMQIGALYLGTQVV